MIDIVFSFRNPHRIVYWFVSYSNKHLKFSQMLCENCWLFEEAVSSQVKSDYIPESVMRMYQILFVQITFEHNVTASVS